MMSIVLACFWAIAANVIAMLPTKDAHWTSAYILIAVGIPILGFVTWQNGPWIALIVLVAGMSVLRWPVIYLGRWLRRLAG
ncbi:MAG: DUF2484 family protein [Rhodobacteraceae bacterium]|nr:DUF2484 family protein [Paracoccaceae bacterium]